MEQATAVACSTRDDDDNNEARCSEQQAQLVGFDARDHEVDIVSARCSVRD